MSLRSTLKKVRTIYQLNAWWKSHQLKRRRVRLTKRYNAVAARQAVHYDESDAINQFRACHLQLKPEFSAQPRGHLRMFWVGTSYNQDNAGLLQALRTFGPLDVFHNHVGEYGLWNNRNRAGIYDREVVARNSQALQLQVEGLREKPNVLIGQMWAGRVSAEVLHWVRCQGIPVINIAMDDRLPQHWGWCGGRRLGSVGLGEGVDMVLTTSPECCSWYACESMSALYMPLASSPEIYRGDCEAERPIDVLFIGNKYGIREKIVEQVRASHLPICVYGAGWPNGVADFAKSVELARAAKIILGIGTVGYCNDVYTLKLRDFDAPMSGALYITHRNPDLAALFREGTEIEFYTTIGELVLKLRKYLQNDLLRVSVAASGQKKAIRRDSWDARLTTNFVRLGLLR